MIFINKKMKKKIRLTETELVNMIHSILSETDLPTNENAEFKEAINKSKGCRKNSDCPPGMECRIGGDGVNGLCKYKDEFKESKKNTLRMTESELTNFIKQVVIESNTKKRRIQEIEGTENFFNPQALDTADAIYTIIATTVGMLGIAGYDVLKGYAKELMKAGKRKEGREMMSAIKDMQSKGEQGGEIGEGKSCGVNEKLCRGMCIPSSYYCCPDGRVEPPGNRGCYQGRISK
jgi:hypothetical protein